MCAGLFLSVSACGGGSSSGGSTSGGDSSNDSSVGSGSGGDSSSGGPGNKTPDEPTVLIPAGTFTMGSNDGKNNDGNFDEKPVHEVYLDAFRIDTYEVTVADYKTCVDKAGSNCKTPRTGTHYSYNWGVTGRDKYPVNGVDWNDATAYCQFAGKRLPTEAEWEKVASWKDGKKYKYPSGKNTVSCTDAVMYDSKADGCGKDRTWEVGSKPKEINRTYDMAGNVSEWVSDWYGVYPADKQTNPKGAEAFEGQFSGNRVNRRRSVVQRFESAAWYVSEVRFA